MYQLGGCIFLFFYDTKKGIEFAVDGERVFPYDRGRLFIVSIFI